MIKKKKKNECHTAKIENVLKSWKMIDLSIEDKITIFKTLPISKIVHLRVIASVPAFII